MRPRSGALRRHRKKCPSTPLFTTSPTTSTTVRCNWGLRWYACVRRRIAAVTSSLTRCGSSPSSTSSTGSRTLRELPRAAGVPREDTRVQGHGRPGGRDGRLQPLRFLPRAAGRELPLQVHRIAGAGARSLSGGRPRHAAGGRLPREGRSQDAAHHRLPGRPQPAGAAGRQLPDPHGARRADARADAGEWLRLLSRLGLAAGAAAAKRRPGGALRLGLPDPARARREGARRPKRHHGRLHRPARLVRGLPAGRRLDRSRRHLGPDGRRRPHPAGVHAHAFERCADRGRGRRGRGRLRPRDEGHAHPRIAARNQALHGRPVGRGAGAGRGRGCAPLRR